MELEDEAAVGVVKHRQFQHCKQLSLSLSVSRLTKSSEIYFN